MDALEFNQKEDVTQRARTAVFRYDVHLDPKKLTDKEVLALVEFARMKILR